MRVDIERWGDRLQRFSDHADRFELALTFALLAGAIGGGVALLVGRGWVSAALVGACAAGVCLAVLWVRARRGGTRVFGDDWFER